MRNAHEQQKKYFIGILIALLLLIPLVLIGILTSLDFNQYKPQLVAQVEALTGRKMTIDGDLELLISLRPSIEVSGVSLANAPWSSTEQMALSASCRCRWSCCRC